MTSHAEAIHDHHGPPEANKSSRIDAKVLGMLLFIASEAMLFGSFFTAYFFVRVVNPDAPSEWPPEPYHFPVFVAGVNTAILVTSSFTMHWALQSIKRGNRPAFLAGMVLTFLMGFAFLLTQVVEYLNVGFNTGRRGLRLGLLRAHRAARRACLHRAHAARRWSSCAGSAATSRPSTTTASSFQGSTGTSSTSCGSSSTRSST